MTRISSVRFFFGLCADELFNSVLSDALANGSMSSLDLGTQTSATGSSLSWNNVGSPPFTTTNYNPTMALAQNHIHFIGVPGNQPGTADIFVIHCKISLQASAYVSLKSRLVSFFQPTPQSYPVGGGGSTFPSTHGQTASIFLESGVWRYLLLQIIF